MSDKIKDVVKRLRDRAEARRRSGKLLQIDDRMFDLIADEIEEAAKTLEADRDNRRKQALDEDARANATCDKSSQVGNAAEMYEALESIRDLLCHVDLRVDEDPERSKVFKIACAALSAPPRNCDVGNDREQDLRFYEFCGSHTSCVECPLREGAYSCSLSWAQMPYEEVK